MSLRTKAILINAALLTACAIQLARGYRPLVIAICFAGFFVAANVGIFLAGSAERKLRRRREREYWAQ